MSAQRQFLISAANHPRIPVHDFVGRDSEINALVELLSPQAYDPASSAKVAVIDGEAGVGKTELSRAVAYRLRPEFPDAQLAIEYSRASDGTLAVRHILETIVHALDPLARLPDDLNELQALYLSLLEGKRVLVLVDRVGNEPGIDFLIPPPTCALLLTSRHPLQLPTASALHLGKLSPTDAEHLLVTISPKVGSHAPVLAQLCRHTPLALRLSAALLAHDGSLDTVNYIRLLSEQAERIAASKEQPEALLEPLLRQVYERLDTRAQQAFCQLAIFSDGFSQAAAAALANIDGSAHQDMHQRLATLSELNLLAFDEATKLYQMYPSVRAFALENLIDPSEARLRLAQRYAGIAESCAALAHRGSDGVLLGALLFDDHKLDIRQAWAWLEQQEQRTPIIDALIVKFHKIAEALGRLRFFPEHELIPRSKVALESAQRLGDPDATLSILGSLGTTYYMLGQGQQALDCYEQQFGLARQRGNRDWETEIRRNMSLAQALLGRSP